MDEDLDQPYQETLYHGEVEQAEHLFFLVIGVHDAG